ncbi:zinc-ribbon domain-containing protein [Oceanobacillus halophilus]|uniref:Zinc-ribbon domain-containing protein n=1 Tax=Oceanobacillus halophilus TaxID=930130 RepID=A0A495A9C5_9BACI|nr:zinc-ribbon domain-containing protein [Oceanobacillus halophilus]
MLSLICHHCGEPIPEGSHFCMNCGSKVIADNKQGT